ncbi:UNVERIFIED_CONTAM: ABC transporter G family member 35 [Sesamum indicum]
MNKVVNKVVDVRKLDAHEREEFIDRVLKVTEEDNEKFLRKLRNRIDEAGIELPTAEVGFEKLTLEADCFIGERALPTLPNAARNIAETALSCFGIKLPERAKLKILNDVSGIIKPSSKLIVLQHSKTRMTLLLGPPSSGKTTLLLALVGRLTPSLKASGEITYNGHKLNEFVPQKTAVDVSQNDVHVAEMTVGETLEFSARCQGVGSRYELLKEVTSREKEASIVHDADIDLFMKATALDGVGSGLITDYVLKVVTGEMIVRPSKTLFMDEISTGLDSSTTLQVVKCLQQIAHLTKATILMSLLQLAPETFNLFDDIVLLSQGQTVYHGPREHVIEFFESCGFKCPERKGIADFLQEVMSEKDQEQYWTDGNEPYKYIPVSEFAERFKHFHVGVHLQHKLSVPYKKDQSHKAALVYDKYLVPRKVLFKAIFDKEWLLIKRNSFFYVFKTVQIIIVAMIASTVFLRTKLHARNEEDGAVYVGALVFGMIINTFNGYVEISLTIQRLPVLYKHRDLLFHRPWAFTIPNFLLRIPISLSLSCGWSQHIIQLDSPLKLAGNSFFPFFKQLLWVFLIQQVAVGSFRLIAGICKMMIISKTDGSLTLLLVFLLGGFILLLDQIPVWWRWAYWVSPLSYGYNAVTVNEMFASRLGSDNVTRLGVAVLKQFDVFSEEKWYWIGIAALFGFTVLFNVLFTIALVYLNPLGKPQGTISQDQATVLQTYQEKGHKKDSLPRSPSATETSGVKAYSTSNWTNRNEGLSVGATGGTARKGGMILPFTPLSMSFYNVNYFVDMPQSIKEKGATEKKLQLLHELTGAFRPGVLTALMGVSGAGKTTLMDVLAGRKTRGYIEGEIRISGFPKQQETFARISGYCEQYDIHSPQVTVHESLVYSAFFRLPKDVGMEEILARTCLLYWISRKPEFELDNLKEAMVGIPGVTGLSTEQRKRLTIAVELVANPPILFMDEPTSGLDARAAAIVMRTVRNTVDTGRTVVCTIHQPGIDIFAAFDELFLMKRGGQVIYAGPIGWQYQCITDYFETETRHIKRTQPNAGNTWSSQNQITLLQNPDTVLILESTTNRHLYISKITSLVKELSSPPPGAKDLYFPKQYSQSTWGQFKFCLWKQQWTYWRSPDYNLSRFFFTLAAALMVGLIF